MKKVFLFFILIGSLALLNSCSDESPVKKTESISEKVKINISNPLGRAMEFEAEFTAEIDPETELVISYDVSENLLEYVNMDRAEFDAFLQNEMGGNYYTIFNGENGDSQTPHSDCMEGCDKNYRDEEGNKLPGMGRCRWRCWVDTAVRIIEAIL